MTSIPLYNTKFNNKINQQLNEIKKMNIQDNQGTYGKDNEQHEHQTAKWLKVHQEAPHLHTPCEKEFKKYRPKINKQMALPNRLHSVLEDSTSKFAPPKKPFVPSTSELKQQFRELKSIEEKMADREKVKHHGTDVLETIAWLKNYRYRSSNEDDIDNVTKVSSPYSFLESTLNFLSKSKIAKLSNQKMNTFSQNWGIESMNLNWYELGFGLIDRPLIIDMMNLRKVIASGEIKISSPRAIAELTKWLQGFNEQLHMSMSIKARLLEERCDIIGQEIRVQTLYDHYQYLMNEALDLSTGDRTKFGEKILQCFNELDACLRDEQNAVSNILQKHVSIKDEYQAIYNLISNITEDDVNGVYWSKLFCYICNSFKISEREEFVHAMSEEVQQELGTHWMRIYAAHVQLLSGFHIDFTSGTAYSRSSAHLY